jgi:hypothetical protein
VVLPTGGALATDFTVSVGSCGLNLDQLGLPTTYPIQPSPVAGTADALSPALILPPTASSGSTLRYLVVLTNPTDLPTRLLPCPSYTEAVGYPNSVVRTYWLNCSAVPELAPGQGEKFSMQLLIPRSVLLGVSKFSWHLNTPDEPGAGGTIRIV